MFKIFIMLPSLLNVLSYTPPPTHFVLLMFGQDVYIHNIVSIRATFTYIYMNTSRVSVPYAEYIYIVHAVTIYIYIMDWPTPFKLCMCLSSGA